MSNPAKQKGTKGERDRVAYLRSRGWHFADRIVQHGSLDEGDIRLDPNVPIAIESKETKAFTPSQFITELTAEIENAHALTGFVIVKRRGTTDVGQYYALCTVDQIMTLVELAFDPTPVRKPKKLLRRVVR